ncbi:MAG TPA: LysM domain-containing protein, partial [Alphaproteobacteria bacterium]|nr:LysM domain-containing protein [Alphaproteobacteria bacterium]
MTLRVYEAGHRPPPPSSRQNDAAFDLQVRIAQAERARAERQPPERHGYETAREVQPDEWLERIAVQEGIDPLAIEAANRQFETPDLIQPGEIVFLPGESPVGGETEQLIDEALRFDREQNGAGSAASDANWQRVQSAIAGELQRTAPGTVDPVASARGVVEEISAWAVGTDKLREAGHAAFEQVTGEWRQRAGEQQQAEQLPDIDVVLDGVNQDLETLRDRLDEHGFVREAWGWLREHTGGERSKFEEFLETTAEGLEDIKERQDDGELPTQAYA